MQVNFMGMVRCTKYFLPQLKKNKGRVVNVISIEGLSPMPSLSAYTCSKHAADAFTRCLAVEMEPFGVCVSVVSPGAFKTRLLKGGPAALRRAFEATPPEIRCQYSEGYVSTLEACVEFFYKLAASSGDPVAGAVEDAVVGQSD